jgi:hypothetical protein
MILYTQTDGFSLAEADKFVPHSVQKHRGIQNSSALLSEKDVRIVPAVSCVSENGKLSNVATL